MTAAVEELSEAIGHEAGVRAAPGETGDDLSQTLAVDRLLSRVHRREERHTGWLLAGPTSSAGARCPTARSPDRVAGTGSILIVEDLDDEGAHLRDAGERFRNDIVEGPGGRQVLVEDPSDNIIELFEPASH